MYHSSTFIYIYLHKCSCLLGTFSENLGQIGPSSNFGPTGAPLKVLIIGPVCKILDYGKYKYAQQKKANEARKKQKIIDVKEIKRRPGIEEHDYQVKMRNVRKFLDHGDKVKMTIRFRGREMAHQDLGLRVLNRVQEELEDSIKIEQMPTTEGRLMVMVIAPR